MCDFTECEHTKKSPGPGAEWLVKAPFMVIGACFAVTLAVGVVRMVLPWLAGGLAVVFGVLCVTAVAVRVRRRRRLRALVPAPLPSAPRTAVTGVTVQSIGQSHSPPIVTPSRAVSYRRR